MHSSAECYQQQGGGAGPPTSTALTHSQYNSLIDSAKLHGDLEKREQFAVALKEFMSREKYRRGHMSFIRVAVHRMDEFSLEKDLLTYNRLLDIFPKGKFVPHRMLDAFWPRSFPQIDLALDLLSKMEDNGVRPDYNTHMLLIEIFGKTSFPVDKCQRIAYWFDKYENADPYWISRDDLPAAPVELTRLALKRINGSTGLITDHKVSLDETFIVSGSTRAQVELLRSLSDMEGELLHVEGPHRLWLKDMQLLYYSLRLSSNSQHNTEEREGAVLGVCMCAPGTAASVKEWLGALQDTYPALADATVVYNVQEEEDGMKQLPSGTTQRKLGVQCHGVQ